MIPTELEIVSPSFVAIVVPSRGIARCLIEPPSLLQLEMATHLEDDRRGMKKA